MDEAQPRRDFLTKVSFVAMTGGLAASYGTFAVLAGRFLFPSGQFTKWTMVLPAGEIPPGATFSFKLPSGEPVVIRRREDAPANEPATPDQFLALSSVCPHLGCRVHWEPQNNRYFCPCHNGVFDPQGRAIAGPPAAAGQSLPAYAIQVQEGLLLLEMPLQTLDLPIIRPASGNA